MTPDTIRAAIIVSFNSLNGDLDLELDLFGIHSLPPQHKKLFLEIAKRIDFELQQISTLIPNP